LGLAEAISWLFTSVEPVLLAKIPVPSGSLGVFPPSEMSVIPLWATSLYENPGGRDRTPAGSATRSPYPTDARVPAIALGSPVIAIL